MKLVEYKKIDKFQHLNEPYGTVNMVDCTVFKLEAEDGDDGYMLHRAKAGMMEVHGTVESGGETSRLFQYTSTRDLKGEKWSVGRVTEADLERGYIRTIAM